MNILITGGTGNLARHCHDEFRAAGHRVTSFDRFRPADAARPWATDAPFGVGDLTSRDDCRRAVQVAEAEGIVHLGAIAYASEAEGARRSAIEAGQSPVPADATFRVNVLGTYFILEAARDFGTRSIVFASTASVLLESNSPATWLSTMPIDENHDLRPSNSYSISKYLNEETLRLFARDAAGAYRLAIESDRPEVEGPMYLATDRTCAEEHRDLITQYFPKFAATAKKMGSDDLIISIRRARQLLGYVPRYSWRGTQVGDYVW